MRKIYYSFDLRETMYHRQPIPKLELRIRDRRTAASSVFNNACEISRVLALPDEIYTNTSTLSIRKQVAGNPTE